MKFFEKAMVEHHNPSPKPGQYFIFLSFKYQFNLCCLIYYYVIERVFSFLSQDEVEKMKQEEGIKFNSINNNNYCFYDDVQIF